MSFISLKNCLSEPKQLLKLIILIICVCVATYQLSECFRKIIHPPISSYYSFQLNESVTYPAVTICRNPGYKTDVFPKYGLTSDNIAYTSNWRNFNYSLYSLTEFFEEATYSIEEILYAASFEGCPWDTVEIKPFYLMRYGRCFTINAVGPSSTFSETGGYIFSFTHTEAVKVRNFFGISLSGYHIYIHDPAEVLTGQESQENSFIEYLYLEAGEDLRVNLRVQKYNQIASHDKNCVADNNYSQSKCIEECVYKQITDMFNCTAPWINIGGIDKPECSSYNTTRSILLYYTENYREKYLQPCNCPTTCNISVYSTYVQSRKEVTMPESNLSLYFSSNLITVLDEVVGYDWNAFLSDMGGSLGFLLGLSVIGAITVLEQLILLLFCRKKKSEDEEKENVAEEETHEEANNFKSITSNVPQISITCNEVDDKEKSLEMEKNSVNNNIYFNKAYNNNEKTPIIEKY